MYNFSRSREVRVIVGLTVTYSSPSVLHLLHRDVVPDVYSIRTYPNTIVGWHGINPVRPNVVPIVTSHTVPPPVVPLAGRLLVEGAGAANINEAVRFHTSRWSLSDLG